MRSATLAPIYLSVFVALATAQGPSAASAVHRTGIFHGKEVQYQISGEYAVTEGDIILGTVAEMESGALAADPAASSAKGQHGSLTYDQPTRWPDGTIPYVIDSTLTNQQRVLDAVQYWNTNTPLKVVPRTNEANYVRFVPVTFDAACASALGMRGGEQLVQVTTACTSNNLVHELGHAFGLLHEQQRVDRNSSVTVLYQNIDKRYTSDFDQSLYGGTTDAGFYDYDSIMHYGSQGFTNNGLDSIETVPVGIPIGQRDHLSPGDIDSVSRLYNFIPTATTVTTTPMGLRITVDGAPVTSPARFNWTPGSTHIVSVDAQQGTDPRYVFGRWSDGGALTHSITASANQTVYSAQFVRQHHVASGVSDGQGTVRVLPASADGYYSERSVISVSAAPAGGYKFLRWLGTTNFQANFFGVSTPSAPLEVTLVNANYLGSFTQAPLTTITSEPLGRIVTVDGTAYYTPVNLALTQGSSHTITLTTPQLDGNNTRRYNFTQWDDGSTSTTRAFVAGSQDITYKAFFKPQFLVTALTTGSGRGAIQLSPTSPDGFYDAGTTLQVTAQPNSGSSFWYWIGDLGGGSASLPLVVSEQRQVVANFATGGALPFRVVSAASFQGNPQFTRTGTVVSPGEIVTLFGSNLGPATLTGGILDGNNRFTTQVAGTRILFDGVPAPIIYASATQTSVIVPYAVTGQTSTRVQVESQGTILATSSISVGPTAPALFTLNASGSGQVAALNQNTSVNSPANPAQAGSVVVLYATGEGAVSPGVNDGQVNSGTLPKPLAPVYVRVGKEPAEILYAGAAPGLVAGVIQINARVPQNILPGSAVPIQISIGNVSSPPGTTIAVQ